jgi:plasmid replication initiation protein
MDPASQLDIWKTHRQDEIVVKANELVMGQLDWTVWEYRIFLAHVAQLRKEDTEFELQRVRLRDIERFSGTRTKALYKIGEEVAERMTDKKVRVKSRGKSGKDRYSAFNVYSSCHYENGVVEGRFTKEMKPLLLQLKDRGFFTMYLKRLALSLSSIYALRFYEIIKRYEKHDGFYLTVDEIREIFNLEDKYDRFSDLRRRVIETAKKEIDEQCDITFDYTIEREGQTPVGVQFRIRPNVKNPAKEATTKDGGQDQPAPRHRPSHTNKDDVEAYFDALTPEAQEVLRSEARVRAERDNPEAGKAVIESQTWKHIRQLVSERYLDLD